jgi:hypothetical protein
MAGKTVEKMFGERWIDVLRFNRIDRRHANHTASLKVPASLEEMSQFTPMPHEYPSAQSQEKFILIDLSEQFLGAYGFGRLRFSAPITSGEPGNETPAGDFEITAAHRVHRSTLYTLEGTDIPYPDDVRPEVSYYAGGHRLLDAWTRRSGSACLPRLHRSL